MTLTELLANLPVEPPVAGLSAGDPTITGVSHDSRRIGPGDLFVACRGERVDGRAFAAQAVASGAAAVLAPTPRPDADQDGPWAQVPWWTAEAPRSLLGPIAGRVHGQPDREMALVGITGTNGKSTLVSVVAALCEAAGLTTGTMGTLGYRLSGEPFAGNSSTPTTPEAPDFFATLRKMADAGAQAVAMEVSSHALDQGRVMSALYRVAAFTNLSRDHFDYHDGFEDYFLAKRKLFDQLADDGVAVLPTEDPYGRRLIEELSERGMRVITWGEGGDVSVAAATLDGRGIRGRLSTPRGDLEFETPLIGRYNLLNLTTAAAVGEALGLDHEAIAAGLAAHPPLTGRLEPIDAGQPFDVYVDYAHTDGALEAALVALRELSRGEIILVFGCGGDRDPGKRIPMGRIAGALADRVVLTSDNPRNEDPLAILATVEEGLAQSGASDYRVEPDRRRAIETAIEMAGDDSSVLIAGKGHEAEQLVGGEVFVFSDHDEARAALEARVDSAANR